MMAAIGGMLPLESGHQRRLIDEFASISRAVALATILSALAQAILGGIGYYFAGLGSVLLLTMLTFLGGMIPFVGATIVWLPACLWLYFVQHETVAAIVLAVWCALVVSMVDNFIKPLVLHGQSNLHPLLALLSVLGGVQAWVRSASSSVQWPWSFCRPVSRCSTPNWPRSRVRLQRICWQIGPDLPPACSSVTMNLNPSPTERGRVRGESLHNKSR